MSFTKCNVEKYTFRFERGDEVYINDRIYQLSGAHAIFVLDIATFTLLIESDWGVYGYRWGVSSQETFKELMTRISEDYLLNKLSDRTEIDWDETEKEAIKCFDIYAKDKKRKKEFLYELKHVDQNEVRFYDFMEEFTYDIEASYFCKDYPVRAQVIVAIFKKYLIPELKKELGR
ncbi:MAG: hypothetical protein IJA88_00200 [Clostridia bacterium]|nr:hypothetical protein [Clostridia bacterium]